MKLYQNFFKRILDVFISIMIFIILFPVFILVLVTLLITTNGKPFYLQERPGKNERIFKIMKFKTMKDAKNNSRAEEVDKTRITAFGRFLRKYSLDEIPQLLNVLKGDMSLIGPRPLLPRYLQFYNDFQKQRHNIKPGITGWAQVNGRNAIDWDTRFALDVWYVHNISFATDVKILWKTFFKVFKTEGVYNQANEINEEFTGSK